ncbi:MAG: leucine-rich repeat domain-containing protein, partial [Clostridia bacterium]|nr:leucine-rich repeat domain-containing protein [Clostridia bacterium]
SNLASINIPEGITVINYDVFRNCSSLTSIHIPDSVTSISEFAFSGCTSLTAVNYPRSLTNINGSLSPFLGCSQLTSISIPEGVTKIPAYTFYGMGSLTSIEIPSTVIKIGNNAFYGHNTDLVFYCDRDSYADQYAQANAISVCYDPWPYDEPIYHETYTISGTVKIGSTPVESAYVFALVGEDAVNFTHTDRNGRWSMRLSEGTEYTLEYHLNGYTLSSGTTIVTPVEDVDIGIAVLVPSAQTDDSVTFTMSADSQTVGTTVHFTVNSTVSDIVQLVVDGVPYEYFLLIDGTRSFDRVFHQGGTRSICFSVIDEDGATHFSASQTLTLNSNGPLQWQGGIHPIGDQYVGQDIELSWDTVPDAQGYIVYVYSEFGRIYPISTNSYEDSMTSDTHFTVDGGRIQFSGEYSVEVVAFADNRDQASASQSFTVYETAEPIEISFAESDVVAGDAFIVNAVLGRQTVNAKLKVTVGNSTSYVDLDDSNSFFVDTKVPGTYMLTPCYTSDGSNFEEAVEGVISVDVRKPRISKLQQGTYTTYAYEPTGSVFAFSGSMDANTAIVISGPQFYTIGADEGVSSFNWTSDAITETGVYTFTFTPVRTIENGDDISGSPKSFTVAVMQSTANMQKYISASVPAVGIPGTNYIRGNFPLGASVTEKYVCGAYSLVSGMGKNSKGEVSEIEGFVLTEKLTANHVDENADRIIRVVCMDALPDYVSIGSEKVYGVVTTNDVISVTATVTSVTGNTTNHTFDLSNSEEWELEYPTAEQYRRFTCNIPIETAAVISITWTATDSFENNYLFDEITQVMGLKESSLFPLNTRLYSKVRGLAFWNIDGETCITLDNPSDYYITLCGESLYVPDNLGYCFQIRHIGDETIEYGCLLDIYCADLTATPTDNVVKRGIIIAAYCDKDSAGNTIWGDFSQDSGYKSMNAVKKAYQAAGITLIETVEGPKSSKTIEDALRAIFYKGDYTDILYITIIAHGAEDTNTGKPLSPLAWSLGNGKGFFSSSLNGIISSNTDRIEEVHIIIDSCFAGTYSYEETLRPPVIDVLMATTGDDTGNFIQDFEKDYCLTFSYSLFMYMTEQFNSEATLSQLCNGTYNRTIFCTHILGWDAFAGVVSYFKDTKPTCWPGTENNVFFRK